MAHSLAVPDRQATSQAKRKYRPELQGVRALAALLVVAYHIWFNRISGGVDIFFLISGFLITGQLVRAASGKGIQFRAMWGRMFKRLLPAALTVLVVCMAVSLALLPQDRWLQTIKETVASALYYENWQLAADSVNYFARHNTQSFAQHYWSLSIQGQFYLVWPLLIFGIALLARKVLKRKLSGVVAVVLAVVFLASLAYSVYLTDVNQQYAYFNSFTRVWEFALGGLLALFIDAIVLPRVLRIVLGWIGVVGIVSCGLVIDVGTVFPGYVALWPTMSAALTIMAGATESKFGADFLLASKPLEYLGNISYSLYLWHWPLMLFWLLALDRDTIGLRGGLVLLAASLVLAMLSYHFIESPVRDSKIGVNNRWGAYRFAVIALVPTLVLAGGWQLLSQQEIKKSQLADASDPNYPGARAQQPGFQYAGDEQPEIRPSLISLPNDWAVVRQRQCTPSALDKELSICKSPTNGKPSKRVVIVGDSHAQQFIAPLNDISKRRNWQLVSMLKGACPFSTKSEDAPGDRSCVNFNKAAEREIVKMHPDAVITLASRNVQKGLTESTPPGFAEQWRRLGKAGIPVLAVRDTPRFSFSPPNCVQAKGKDNPSCGAVRKEYLADKPPYEKVKNLPENTDFLDFSNYLCTDTVCPPVIGNVYVYLDDNHPSATYLRTMAPIWESAIDDKLGWRT
ncbi:acyltransferase family protein [Sciscionella marina]|uniref:acyltransferase family protein n=1 Tax=Sciscionella marina TaxID=508770 RepID=UPI0003624F97|nr:acyltransferase family protein [Sciscionella marina]